MTMARIKAVVAEHYRLPIRVIDGPLRWGDYVWPRQLAMYLCGELLKKSNRQVGDFFGGRDPSTVQFARRRVLARLEADPDMRAAVAGLIVAITAENLRAVPVAQEAAAA